MLDTCERKPESLIAVPCSWPCELRDLFSSHIKLDFGDLFDIRRSHVSLEIRTYVSDLMHLLQSGANHGIDRLASDGNGAPDTPILCRVSCAMSLPEACTELYKKRGHGQS